MELYQKVARPFLQDGCGISTNLLAALLIIVGAAHTQSVAANDTGLELDAMLLNSARASLIAETLPTRSDKLELIFALTSMRDHSYRFPTSDSKDILDAANHGKVLTPKLIGTFEKHRPHATGIQQTPPTIANPLDLPPIREVGQLGAHVLGAAATGGPYAAVIAGTLHALDRVSGQSSTEAGDSTFPETVIRRAGLTRYYANETVLGIELLTIFDSMRHKPELEDAILTFLEAENLLTDRSKERIEEIANSFAEDFWSNDLEDQQMLIDSIEGLIAISQEQVLTEISESAAELLAESGDAANGGSPVVDATSPSYTPSSESVYVEQAATFAYRGALLLGYGILQRTDPKAAARLMMVGDATLQIHQATQQYRQLQRAGGLAAGLATGGLFMNIGGIAMGLATAAQPDPTAMQLAAIQRQIEQLTVMVQELHVEVLEMGNRLEVRLQTMSELMESGITFLYQGVRENAMALSVLDDKFQRLSIESRTHHLELIDAIQGAELRANVSRIQCTMLLRAYFGSPIRLRNKLTECAEGYAIILNEIASSPAYAGSARNIQDESVPIARQIIDSLRLRSNSGPNASIDYAGQINSILSASQALGIRSQPPNTPLPNPQLWYHYASEFSQFLAYYYSTVSGEEEPRADFVPAIDESLQSGSSLMDLVDLRGDAQRLEEIRTGLGSIYNLALTEFADAINCLAAAYESIRLGSFSFAQLLQRRQLQNRFDNYAGRRSSFAGPGQLRCPVGDGAAYVPRHGRQIAAWAPPYRQPRISLEACDGSGPALQIGREDLPAIPRVAQLLAEMSGEGHIIPSGAGRIDLCYNHEFTSPHYFTYPNHRGSRIWFQAEKKVSIEIIAKQSGQIIASRKWESKRRQKTLVEEFPSVRLNDCRRLEGMWQENRNRAIEYFHENGEYNYEHERCFGQKVSEAPVYRVSDLRGLIHRTSFSRHFDDRGPQFVEVSNYELWVDIINRRRAAEREFLGILISTLLDDGTSPGALAARLAVTIDSVKTAADRLTRVRAFVEAILSVYYGENLVRHPELFQVFNKVIVSDETVIDPQVLRFYLMERLQDAKGDWGVAGLPARVVSISSERFSDFLNRMPSALDSLQRANDPLEVAFAELLFWREYIPHMGDVASVID